MIIDTTHATWFLNVLWATESLKDFRTQLGISRGTCKSILRMFRDNEVPVPEHARLARLTGLILVKLTYKIHPRKLQDEGRLLKRMWQLEQDYPSNYLLI